MRKIDAVDIRRWSRPFVISQMRAEKEEGGSVTDRVPASAEPDSMAGRREGGAHPASTTTDTMFACFDPSTIGLPPPNNFAKIS